MRCFKRKEKNYLFHLHQQLYEGGINRSVIEKLIAAMHWGIKYYRPYLYSKKFLVKSYHRPLVYLFAVKNSSSKENRIRLDLGESDFQIWNEDRLWWLTGHLESQSMIQEKNNN